MASDEYNFFNVSNFIDISFNTGIDPNQIDSEKHSLVHWATVCSQIKALELLLEKGALPSTPDLFGAHALHYATQIAADNKNEGMAIMRLLLKHAANVNCADLDERTPLLWAASSGMHTAVAVKKDTILQYL